jgi:hypothetical protein
MNPETPSFNPDQRDDRVIVDEAELILFDVEIQRQLIDKLIARGERDVILPAARRALDEQIGLLNRLLREDDASRKIKLVDELEGLIDKSDSVLDEYEVYRVIVEQKDFGKLLLSSDESDFVEKLHNFCDFYYGKDRLPLTLAVELVKQKGMKQEFKRFVRGEFEDNAEFLTELGFDQDEAEEVLMWLGKKSRPQ